MSDPTHILRIDASARHTGSVSRNLVDAVLDRLASKNNVHIQRRDVANGLPLIDEEWVGANFTPVEARTQNQRNALALSDTLVRELQDADVIVFGLPIYNFSVPASLKAWIDLVARAGVTFKYTNNGPEGLLENKQAIVVLVSGGTISGSEIDFATPYIRHVLGFMGIFDVKIITADALGISADEKISQAKVTISKL
ncbi:FMN-dependent NADH-azoreductase [Hirschia litorea]|uniref:FMN dependent NADH:quinone oxidoreductase n=1 Tax=Hirschia litorea TaxID=1199156 RepID=A0ABW2IHY4_9PROT